MPHYAPIRDATGRFMAPLLLQAALVNLAPRSLFQRPPVIRRICLPRSFSGIKYRGRQERDQDQIDQGRSSIQEDESGEGPRVETVYPGAQEMG